MRKKVRFAPFLVGVAGASAVVSAIVSWLISPHVALGFAVFAIGSMVALAYWRLRRAQATTTRACAKISEQLSSLHSRSGHQFGSLSSQISTLSIPSTPSSDTPDGATDQHQRMIADSLKNQRALLQEIIVQLDLASAPTVTSYTKC
ncbi:hypothetical protein [Corynebacterium qintianiae]|uniref:hypothetical protein n=1 Tax=Corynebacterium qintianiae TaxID=2709392 RepID=UPI0013EC7A77|nr:hypothetical protein [Corynebacterium qintianiae]